MEIQSNVETHPTKRKKKKKKKNNNWTSRSFFPPSIDGRKR